jgi:hypothetical protein
MVLGGVVRWPGDGVGGEKNGREGNTEVCMKRVRKKMRTPEQTDDTNSHHPQMRWYESEIDELCRDEYAPIANERWHVGLFEEKAGR